MTRHSSILALSFAAALLAAAPAAAEFPWCGNPFPPCDPDSLSSECYRPKPPDERCEPTECDKCKKSPCYVASGVYEGSAVDLELPTAGLPLSATRTYESSQLIDGTLGYGWTSSLAPRLHYTAYLFAAPNTYQRRAVVTMPDGARYVFVDNADGTFAPPLGRYDRLVRNTDGSFDLTLQRSRTSLHFGADGALLSMTDEFGNAHATTYDPNGRVERIADTSGSGRFIDVFWGADGRISTLQDSAGRTVDYAYDARGVMTSVTDAAARTTSYSYVQRRYVPLLAAVRDHWNRVVTEIVYDSADRVRSYSDQLETWTYTYNYQNDRTKTAKTDELGKTWVYTHGAGGLVTASAPPAGAGGATSFTSYNPDGSIQQEMDEVGIKTFYTYDTQGRVTSVTRDHQGSQAVRYDYTYDPNFPDKVAAVTPRNPVTGATDTSWQAWRYDYYPAGSAAPGALHHVHRVRADGTTLDALATYTYDTRGRVLSAADAAGATTEYVYGAAGDLVTVTAPANNDLGIRPITRYEHDGLGRVTSVTDPSRAETTYSYDSLGRLLTATLPPPAPGSPLDFTTTYEHDDFDPVTGLLFTNITDPNGNLARQGHDQFDRLIQSTDHLGARTRYTYDGALLVTVTDPNDNVTSYLYDALRRLSSTTFPDGEHESYAYFADGMLQRKTDRKGQTITYTYDPFKRLVQKTYPNATGISYLYAGAQLIQVVDTSVSPAETHLFAYDTSYRLSSNTQAGRGTIGYTYTPGDQVASYTVASGPTASYAYYPDGSLNTIEWSPVFGVFKYSYNPRGQYETILFPNGQSREYTYDDQGRLLELANRHLGIGNIVTFAYGYDRDHAAGTDTMLGQRTSVTADTSALGLGGVETRYRYDANYQLIRADYPSGAPFNGEIHEWTYDAIGNRLTNVVNGVTATYTYYRNGSNPLNGQRLQSDGGRTFAYDNNGNTTTITAASGSTSFAWDFQDRMIGISGVASTAAGYDYSGRRSRRAVAAGTAEFLYNGLDRIADLGTAPAHYLFGPAIDEPLAMLSDATVFYYGVDALGSVMSLNDASTLTGDDYTYDAWGALHIAAPTISNPLAYVAREMEQPGNPQFYRARFYDPSLGRFSSEDPLRFAGDPHPYTYALNDPVLQIDPMGLRASTKPNNCCEKESQAIERAAKGFCAAAKGGGCRAMLNKYGLGPCSDDKCRKPFRVRCMKEGESCGNCGGPCNNIADFTRTIFLQPKAFQPTCGPLQNTFAHEVAHMCGIGWDGCGGPVCARNKKIATNVGEACEAR